MSKCSFSPCDKSLYVSGLCRGHYQQRIRKQKLRPLRDFRPPGIQTLQDLAEWCVATQTEVKDDCLLWTRGCKNGYGAVRFGTKQYSTHRLVYEAANGVLPPGSVVHHTCGHKRCINLRHLQAVTPAENTAESLQVKSLHAEILALRRTNKRLVRELEQTNKGEILDDPAHSD